MSDKVKSQSVKELEEIEIPEQLIRRYFPEGTPNEEIERVLCVALEQYFRIQMEG